ncbi:hypothetical protein JCM8547_003782 [Rhodosporidiobolus lusitaniae]
MPRHSPPPSPPHYATVEENARYNLDRSALDQHRLRHDPRASHVPTVFRPQFDVPEQPRGALRIVNAGSGEEEESDHGGRRRTLDDPSSSEDDDDYEQHQQSPLVHSSLRKLQRNAQRQAAAPDIDSPNGSREDVSYGVQEPADYRSTTRGDSKKQPPRKSRKEKEGKEGRSTTRSLSRGTGALRKGLLRLGFGRGGEGSEEESASNSRSLSKRVNEAVEGSGRRRAIYG